MNEKSSQQKQQIALSPIINKIKDMPAKDEKIVSIKTISSLKIRRALRVLKSKFRKIKVPSKVSKKSIALTLVILLTIGLLSLGLFHLYYYLINRNTVLILNIPESDIVINQSIPIYIAYIDAKGQQQCNEDIELSVQKDNNRRSRQIYRVNDSQIQKMNSCLDTSNSSGEPDYFARITINEPGDYTLTLINKNNRKKLVRSVSVKKDSLDIKVSRIAPVRLKHEADKRYTSIVTVQAKNDIKGKLSDLVPSDFNPVWIGTATVESKGDFKEISWNIDQKAGETKEYAFEYVLENAQSKILEFGNLSLIDQNGARTDAIGEWSVVVTQ